MEQAIKKMIKEYDGKIKVEDIRLESIGKQVRQARAARVAGTCYNALLDDKRVINARRQAYVQAKSDFDSLLDYV